jgi:hypothetical protein
MDRNIDNPRFRFGDATPPNGRSGRSTSYADPDWAPVAQRDGRGPNQWIGWGVEPVLDIKSAMPDATSFRQSLSSDVSQGPSIIIHQLYTGMRER